MYSVFNTLSEYTYFYILKNITLYTFSLVFKIVASLQCILKDALLGKGYLWTFIAKKQLMLLEMRLFSLFQILL